MSDQKITDYMLVSVSSDEHGYGMMEVLEEKVRSHIKSGWEPFGNIVVLSHPNGQEYCQPMIKKIEQLKG